MATLEDSLSAYYKVGQAIVSDPAISLLSLYVPKETEHIPQKDLYEECP